jgi:23S rRNA pseudouridine2605 synthase
MISLKEGKNREVKRLMEHLGLKVARLIRVSFGPFHLGHLPEGAVEEIPGKVWREQLGIAKEKKKPHP